MNDYDLASSDAGASHTPGSDRGRSGRGRALENRQGALASALGSPLSMESDSPSPSARSGDPAHSQDSSQVHHVPSWDILTVS